MQTDTALASDFAFVQNLLPSVFPDLFNLASPPSSLWIQGSLESHRLLAKLPELGLAIVGSRDCQPRSLQLVRQSLKTLRGFKLIIVSGLARGIDAQAHESAIDEGLPTIGVLGCGIDVSYPKENENLRQKILKAGGLIISEFPRDAPPKAHHFIQRNRLIAAWSKAVWVVEAGFRSGAINTATWTKRLERTCYVTPCYPGDLTLAGNQRLLESHQVNEGCVRAYWGPQCLGETWLDLNGFLQVTKKPQSQLPNQSPILQEIQRATTATGGVSWDDLLEWSRKTKVQPELFHRQLRHELEGGNIEVRKGIFIRKLKADS